MGKAEVDDMLEEAQAARNREYRQDAIDAALETSEEEAAIDAAIEAAEEEAIERSIEEAEIEASIEASEGSRREKAQKMYEEEIDWTKGLRKVTEPCWEAPDGSRFTTEVEGLEHVRCALLAERIVQCTNYDAGALHGQPLILAKDILGMIEDLGYAKPLDTPRGLKRETSGDLYSRAKTLISEAREAEDAAEVIEVKEPAVESGPNLYFKFPQEVSEGLDCDSCDACTCCLACTDCDMCVSCCGCIECKNCTACTACTACRDCIACNGLNDERYMIGNIQFTGVEYEAFLNK